MVTNRAADDADGLHRDTDENADPDPPPYFATCAEYGLTTFAAV